MFLIFVRAIAIGAIGVICISFSTGSAHSEPVKSYCVKCIEPSQIYSCNIYSEERRSSDMTLQLYCIVNIARDKNHKSCSVRKTKAGSCYGPVLNYTYSGPLGPSSLSPKTAKQTQEQKKSSTDAVAAEQDEPKTLVDLTKRMVKSSKEQANKTGEGMANAAKSTGNWIEEAAKGTGDAISRAAKSSYDCLRSLFSDCD